MIWKNFNFWEFLFNEEIKLLKKNPIFEDDYFRILLHISIKMINLKMELRLITRILIEYLAKSYIKNVKIFLNSFIYRKN